MDVNKSKWSVVKIKSDAYRAFVSGHPRESSFYFEFPQPSKSLLYFMFGIHYNIAAHHEFLYNGDVFNIVWILIQLFKHQRLPELSPRFIFSFDNLFCVKLNHFL